MVPLVDDALSRAGPLSRDSGPVQRPGRHQGRGLLPEVAPELVEVEVAVPHLKSASR